VLFNAKEFLLAFLPATLVILYLLARADYHRLAVAWLVGACLFFYGWWNPPYLILLTLSILFNFAVGKILFLFQGRENVKVRKFWLIVGIGGNLAALGYFKYFNFFVDNLNELFSLSLPDKSIFLPLAISFFTFHQIAYLVDTYREETTPVSLGHYALFVSFFPQLIAGPIVRFHEVMSRMTSSDAFKLNLEQLGGGITIFLLGLFKKVCLADGMSPYVTYVFQAANGPVTLTFFESWGAALSYALQIYFDFSGYSDMAIGLGLMMGVQLPLNFNSPYKAVNFIDFWRRWHMTLSRFLRDYLYIPLGGNRKGKARRFLNVMITMLLGGLWHGANWTFVFWGGFHGLCIVINHAWHSLRAALGWPVGRERWWGRATAQLLTFIFVVVAWVFFRAETFPAAMRVIKGMVDIKGMVLPNQVLNLAPFLKAFIIGQGTVPFLADGTVMGFIEMTILIGIGLSLVFWGRNLYELSPSSRVYLLIPTFALAMQQVFFTANAAPFLYFRF
jgi:D-alanyl-lipoteichoic acid acyltransferase DltB (MBOAT superfamily)